MPIVRTCVGCRQTCDKADLVRIVAVNGLAVVDDNQILPGRGAYVHPKTTCLDAALRRRALRRALRSEVDATGLTVRPGWS